MTRKLEAAYARQLRLQEELADAQMQLTAAQSRVTVLEVEVARLMALQNAEQRAADSAVQARPSPSRSWLWYVLAGVALGAAIAWIIAAN